jgi:hypothetical protein
MADFTETQQTLLTHQEHTHSVTDVAQVGTEVDVQSHLSATVFVRHANIEVTANASGVRYIVQGRPTTGASVNEKWVDLIEFRTGTTAAVKADITGAEAGGETTLAVDADPTAAFTRGIDVYIHDSGAVADGEWNKCDHSTTGPDIVIIMDGLTNAKDGADEIWTQAELFAAQLQLDGIAYVRGVMIHEAATGSDIVFEMTMGVVTDVE